MLYVLYLQRYGVLEIAQNKTAANFVQNVTHIMHSKMAISQKLLGHSAQNLDLSINMAIEPLVKISAKSETEERGPNKILGDLTWNDPGEVLRDTVSVQEIYLEIQCTSKKILFRMVAALS